jgi:hypothetical protein
MVGAESLRCSPSRCAKPRRGSPALSVITPTDLPKQGFPLWSNLGPAI